MSEVTRDRAVAEEREGTGGCHSKSRTALTEDPDAAAFKVLAAAAA
jgi:hypothetical protein